MADARLYIDWLSHHAPLVIFINLSLGMVGVPGLTEMLLIASGIVAARAGEPPWAAFVAAVSGSAVGMSTSFHVGRVIQNRFGRWAIRARRSQQRLARCLYWCRRYGAWTVAFGYFAPGLRHATAFAAGTLDMDRRCFLAFAIIGASAWAALLLWGAHNLGALGR